MPIKTMPHPKLKRDYKGKRVRTTKDVSNAFWQVPAWSLATVTEQSPKGSYLTFDPCDCCGISARISNVPANCMEFVIAYSDPT